MLVASSRSVLLTYDVGGSHISSGLCDLDTLRLIAKASAPLGEDISFDGFIDLLIRLRDEITGPADQPSGAALAVPGPFDCAEGVSLMQHKLQSLYQRDLRGTLAARFGFEPRNIRFLNDAAAFLLGEVGAGSARGAKKAAGLALGTGIGSAFAENGQCLMSGEAVPPGGEIWNLPYAGGIVEDLISTRALRSDYLARTGKDLEVKEIAAAASDDPQAQQVFTTFGIHLGQVIRDIVAPFHPDIVVIGGGISRSGRLFLPAAETQLKGLNLRIVPSELLEDAALVGAAAFWRHQAGLERPSLAHESQA